MFLSEVRVLVIVLVSDAPQENLKTMGFPAGFTCKNHLHAGEGSNPWPEDPEKGGKPSRTLPWESHDRGSWGYHPLGLAAWTLICRNFIMKKNIYNCICISILPPKGNTTEWAHSHTHSHTHTHTHHTWLSHTHTSYIQWFSDGLWVYIITGLHLSLKLDPLTLSSFIPLWELGVSMEQKRKFAPPLPNLDARYPARGWGVFPRQLKSQSDFYHDVAYR